MQGTLDIVGKHKTLMPNAALLTLTALTPPDVNVEYEFCDENLAPAHLDLACDLVAITGYTLQAERMQVLSDAFRKRGVPVAVGGAFATLEPERARSMADHLFLGEAEETWPRFCAIGWLGRRRRSTSRTSSSILRPAQPRISRA